MSRALRRHPIASRPKPGRRPTIGPRPGPRPPSGRRGRLAFLRPRWIEDIINELKKVTWPTWADTRYLTIVVILVAASVGFMLAGIDLFFNWLIGHTLLR
jgi:preprotein translocase SecE subunit